MAVRQLNAARSDLRWDRRSIHGRTVTAGEFATIGTLSFFPTKNLGGYGDGGMMVTQDDALAVRLRRLRVHGGAREY